MAEFITGIPWLVLLLVFVGMATLQWRALSGLHEITKLLAQMLGQFSPKAADAIIGPNPVIPPSPPPVIPPPIPATPAPARPAGPATPPWFHWAQQQIGFHETGNNQGIERYIALAHCGALGDPWCAIFMNAALEVSGIPGTRSASSQSPRNHPEFVQLDGPALGAIVVFWRGAKDSGLGHVGFYRGEDATRVWTLGGNENDMVQIEALPKSSDSFGLIGYWWPKSVALPKTGPVNMPAGSPTHQTSPSGGEVAAVNATPSSGVRAVQTRITATMFGGQKSAYGGAIDDNSPGVALPFRFEGERPKVRITNANTRAVAECAIVDVGPWNTHDPYWQTGARPQAETGTDMTGRHTNGAGIDLTLAAAKAVGIDGKGLVDWEFVASPLAEASAPKVT